MLFDTHVHTFLDPLASRESELLTDMKRHDIRYATEVAIDLTSSKRTIELAHAYESYYATVGCHPVEGQDLTDDQIETLVREIDTLATDSRVVAIGEIGLDYYHLTTGEETRQIATQKKVFIAMAGLAKKHDLSVVIHTRHATQDTLDILAELGLKKFVIHCFSDTPEFASAISTLSKDAYFGFTGIVTFPKAEAIRHVASMVSLDRILIETDCPFLAPQAVRGTINTPANVRYVLEAIQNLRTEDRTEVEDRIFANSLRFYGIRRED